jgi:hypothetical protein
MNIYFFLYDFLSLLIWGIVPIRQKGGKYFLFFLILISGDIIANITFFSPYPIKSYFATNFFYISSAMLRLISVQEKKISSLSAIIILILCIVTITSEVHGLTYKHELAILSLFHFLFLLKFLQNFIIKFVKENNFSLFLGCLIFYEITATTKYFGLITGFANAGYYLITTTIFEILIGIFFCIFRDDDPRILIKLKNIYADS